MLKEKSRRPLIFSLLGLVLLSLLAIWWINRPISKNSADSKNDKAASATKGLQVGDSSEQARHAVSEPDAALPGKGGASAQSGQQSTNPGNQKVPTTIDTVLGLSETPDGLQPTRVRPRRPLDTTHNYVIIEGAKAHPTRLLAKFSKSAEIDKAKPALLESRYEPFRTPLNRGGLVVLESSMAENTQVANDEEASANGLALAKRMDALRASGQFEYVEPDYIVSIDSVPTDSGFTDGTLWGLKNTGQNGGTSGVDVDAERAWGITTGSDNVVVGVVDTGIRYTHQDLAANMWTNPGESGGSKATNGIDDDGNGYIDDVYGVNTITGSGNPMDDNNHGTHCAGTIGAQSDGGGPHVGVARQVRLMALKFIADNGSGRISDAYECIEYAINMKTKILSNSWGGGGFSQAMFDIIQDASVSQILFVAAAGNSKSNNDITANYPSNYDVDNMVAVAAIDRAGALASFSSYGATKVHLGAPGVSIYSCTASADNSYANYSGTSMATPHVSGVAALVAARYPSESMRALKNRLTAGAQPTLSLAGKVRTGGRVNAYNSLNLTEDRNLEVEVDIDPNPLVGGQLAIFEVIVSDIEKVTGAVVRVRNQALGIDRLLNDTGEDRDKEGNIVRDRVANDGIYTAEILLPEASSLIGVGGTGTLALEFSVTAAGKTDYLQTKTFPFLELAPNDNFSNAIMVSGEKITTSAIGTIAATKEPGEPDHVGNLGGKSVWWKWTTPRTGRVQLDTLGSSFDTLLAVYTGASVADLTEVASNDDLELTKNQYQSSLVFDAVQGETYYIAVDGCRYTGVSFFINSGRTVLKLLLNTPPVANDASVMVQDGVPANLGLVATDVDGQELDYFISQAPANGRANFSNLVDGVFTYTPKPGFRGVDTFRYYVSDGIENSATKLVSITVTAGQDSDGDGIPDAWEIAHRLNPANNDAGLDADGDGLTNFQEYMGSVDPQNAASGPMKIAIELAHDSFAANANWSNSGGNSLRNGLSSVRGPTSPTLAWRAGSNAYFGSSTFIEGNTVVTTRIYPSSPSWQDTKESTIDWQKGGTIVAHRLDTGALLWATQLPLDPLPANWTSILAFPDTDWTSYAIAVRDGRVYATRGSKGSGKSYIYALRLSDGMQIWRSQDICFGEASADVGPVFAPNGDLIVAYGSGETFRFNCLTGATVWKNEIIYGVDRRTLETTNGNRFYGRDRQRGKSFVCAIDPDTGKVKYRSEPVAGGVGWVTGYMRMFTGPDGTVYLPTEDMLGDKFDRLYAFEDTGTTFRLKWHVPTSGNLAFSSFAVGPDGSVYSYDTQNRVVRLRPEDGKVISASIPLSFDGIWPRKMLADSAGVLYVTDGKDKLYSFNADLTLRWSTPVPNNNNGGPALGADRTLVVAGGGENGIYAFRVPEDQQPLPPVITPKMSITYTGNILEQADSPGGPWTVISDATSPWKVPMNAPKKFYRVRLY